MPYTKKHFDCYSGAKFNDWILLERDFNRKPKAHWKCKCICGEIRSVSESNLRGNISTNCGCTRRLDLLGKNFGRWTVVEKIKSSNKSYTMWKCQCICGNMGSVITHNLLSGESKSCGCLHKEVSTILGKARKTHGKRKSRTYSTWQGMIQRCYNPKTIGFEYWGGRGIRVCDKWLKFEGFYEDMGEKPPKLTLDRIDNDKSYCKENCRWACYSTQTRNRRPFGKSHNFIGVYAAGRRWKSSIWYNKKSRHIGTFDTELEALTARNLYVKNNNIER